MSIIRAPRPEQNFMVVRNEVARDERLSYRARGLLVAILSRPDNWRTNSRQLAAEAKEGRDAVRTALRELREAGYVVQHKIRLPNGQLVTEQQVFDRPTGVGKPGAGSPGAGFPGHLRTTEKNNCEEIGSSPRSSREGGPDVFDDFEYPTADGGRRD